MVGLVFVGRLAQWTWISKGKPFGTLNMEPGKTKRSKGRLQFSEPGPCDNSRKTCRGLAMVPCGLENAEVVSIGNPNAGLYVATHNLFHL